MRHSCEALEHTMPTSVGGNHDYASQRAMDIEVTKLNRALDDMGQDDEHDFAFTAQV